MFYFTNITVNFGISRILPNISIHICNIFFFSYSFFFFCFQLRITTQTCGLNLNDMYTLFRHTLKVISAIPYVFAAFCVWYMQDHSEDSCRSSWVCRLNIVDYYYIIVKLSSIIPYLSYSVKIITKISNIFAVTQTSSTKIIFISCVRKFYIYK